MKLVLLTLSGAAKPSPSLDEQTDSYAAHTLHALACAWGSEQQVGVSEAFWFLPTPHPCSAIA